MKKTYIQPTIEACNLPEESILAASPGFDNGTTSSADAKEAFSLSFDILSEGVEE